MRKISLVCLLLLVLTCGTGMATERWVDCYRSNDTVWQYDQESAKILANGDLSVKLKLIWTYGKNQGYYAVQDFTFRPNPLLSKIGLSNIYDKNGKLIVSKDKSINGFSPLKEYEDLDNMRRTVLEYLQSKK